MPWFILVRTVRWVPKQFQHVRAFLQQPVGSVGGAIVESDDAVDLGSDVA